MAKLEGYNDVSYLTRDVHVWPDFHGNRSPLADPSMRGMICGLSINNTEANLALLYLATLQALSVSSGLSVSCIGMPTLAHTVYVTNTKISLTDTYIHNQSIMAPLLVQASSR